jgi:NhaP-type Na+/H+ and K+/H+ antiporter
VQEVVRDGRTLRAGGSFVLEPGDEVVAVVSDVGDLAGIDRIFRGDGAA